MHNFDNYKNIIIKKFPKLDKDVKFDIIDKPDPNYNCIAYAANRTDAWLQPLDLDPPVRLNGVLYNWPFDTEREFTIPALTNIFANLGYVICESWHYEDGFRKVAFYGNGDIQATHAARQLTHGKNKGVWASKLGRSFLITHETPLNIESETYGTVKLFMKKNII